MTTYAACCCVDDEVVPCGNQDVTLQCEPEAIVVEGQLVIGLDINVSWLTTRDAVCGICGSLDTIDSDVRQDITGTRYAVVSFKTLLVRSTGSILNGDALGSVYGTSESSQYQPVVSLQASLSGRYSYTNNSTTTTCLLGCDGIVTSESNVAEINQGRDDPSIDSFSLIRRVSNKDCGSYQWNGCLNESLGPGCYETFDCRATVDIPHEITSDYSKLVVSSQADGFGDCYDQVLVDTRESSNEEGTSRFNLQAIRYAEITIDQSGITDACPQNTPRGFSGMFVPEFGAVDDYYGNCFPAEPCECGQLARLGYIGSWPNAGPNVVSVANSGLVIASLVDPCRGVRFAETSIENDNYTVNETLNCGQTSSSCVWSTRDVGNFGDCDTPQPYNSGSSIRSGGGVSFTQTNASLIFTRHDLLYSLPDPADWPQNV